MIPHPTSDSPEKTRAGLVCAELRRILERFDAADKCAWQARVMGQAGECDTAEAERRDAAGDYWAACMALADLGLLLMRHMLDYRREELHQYMNDVLAPDFAELADAIVATERNR
jgi:hypothetical protein